MTYRRFLFVVLALGLLGSLLVAVRRELHEHRANRVEIVMDDGDFQDLARSYGYDQRAFLIALRRAGLTSLAVSEELGGQISSSTTAAVYPGPALLAQAKLTGLRDPVLAALAARHAIRAGEVYVEAFDGPTAARYAQQLPLHFGARAVQVLHRALPAVFAVRTQGDYFQTVGLGLPADRVALARKLALALVPRLQNDERFGPAQIDRLLGDALRRHDAHTVIFFGLRNQVLGYPDAIDAAASTLRADKADFGTIEVYDPKQLQAGNEALAKDLPANTVRVQAIAKTELDKLTPDQEIQRYLLGVRERNVRVVYLRPFAHQWNGRSIEATNVEIVREIAQGIRKDGMRTGPATPFQRFVSVWWQVALASLAVPAILLLLLDAFGIGGTTLAAVVVALDVLLVLGGFAVHHDMAVRKGLALLGGIAFATAAFVAVAPFFRRPIPATTGEAILDGIRLLATAVVVSLAGALVVVGLLSTPLTMLEVERFTGVKLVLVLPPLLTLALYLFTPWFGNGVQPKRLAESPVTVLQLIGGGVLLAAAFLLVARSGNQSEIAPSALELSIRAHLASLLQVRPRTKEFLFGYPLLMLAPFLVPIDRARWGWIAALAAGVGLADVIDTFSHLHTPLIVSAERVVNGAILGAIVGAILIVLYRRFRRVAAA